MRFLLQVAHQFRVFGNSDLTDEAPFKYFYLLLFHISIHTDSTIPHTEISPVFCSTRQWTGTSAILQKCDLSPPVPDN